MKPRILREVGNENFETEVFGTPGLGVVEFGAHWCPPCRALIPVLEELANVYVKEAKVFTINVDDNAELATKYEIRGLPTVLFFRNSEIVDRLHGKRSKESYSNLINRYSKEG